jgi:hypothetical protein
MTCTCCCCDMCMFGYLRLYTAQGRTPSSHRAPCMARGGGEEIGKWLAVVACVAGWLVGWSVLVCAFVCVSK